MTLDKRTISRFASLFSGYSKAYGISEPTGKISETGKVETKAKTVRGKVDLEQFEQHLNGSGPGLGIVMLRDDDSCLFGAIDYDVRNMDHIKAESIIKAKELPLILCRSKSGGGHFYCFLREPMSAEIMLERLTEWAAILGMSAKVEKFPKQTSRFNDDDVGSYINLPYFKVPNSPRHAIIDGQVASLEQFLSYAEARLVPPAQMTKSWVVETSQLFIDGPPCLQQIEAQGGLLEGTRNDGMVAVVTFLKKKWPDSWKDKVDEYNRLLNANLPSEEIEHLKKSMGRKKYYYRCRLAPINAFCQSKICVKRAFGVGDGVNEEDGTRIYEINAITRYDHGPGEEPVWTMEINGKRVQMSTAQFYSKDEFNKQCMAQIGVVPIPAMAPKKWLQYLNRIVPTADIIQMPVEASPTGQLWEWILKFGTQKVYAMTKEEIILSSKPYREGTMVWFRLTDLFTYLDSHNIKYKNQQAVSMILHGKGAKKDFWNIRNQRGMNVWGIEVGEELTFEENGKKSMVAGDIKPSETF